VGKKVRDKLSKSDKNKIGKTACPICGRKSKGYNSAVAHLANGHFIIDRHERHKIMIDAVDMKAVRKEGNRLIRSDKFYRTKEWREVRYRAIVQYGRKCMACGRTPEHGIIIHVDHIKPKIKHPELALDINNLQILCDDCNLGKGYKDSTDWRSVQLNEELDREYKSAAPRSGTQKTPQTNKV